MIADIRPFKTLIKQRCGLVCEEHCEDKLASALKQRITALLVEQDDYYIRLCDDQQEFQALVNLLTINETYFFREPEQIDLLVGKIVPRLLAARGSTAPLRIFSAGCSSGEEPYSLVMALMEKYGDSTSRLFTFSGGDLDSAVLHKARNARYGDFSFRGVPDGIRQRYFTQDHRHHVLKEHVRKQVSFHDLNLLATPLPPALHDFDVIFFRNVSIYFDTPTRIRIQHNLAGMLKDNGILVIGTAETLANDLGVLPLVEEDGLYYFVKGHPPLAAETAHGTRANVMHGTVRQVVAPPSRSPVSLPAANGLLQAAQNRLQPFSAAAAVSATSQHALHDARRLLRDKFYDEALPKLDTVLGEMPDHAEAQLLKAHVLINRNAFAAAESLARRVLANDIWCIDALLLLGLAAKWQLRPEEAIRHFKHAAYARHECWPAHYYLADLYRANGETDLAHRAYRVVIQLLSGVTPNTGVEYIPFGLPANEIRFLCEHRLAKADDAHFQAGVK